MSDQLERGSEQGRTGVPAVDEVLAEVDSLDGRELADHIEVFTHAHEELRAVLDAASLDAPERA